jgi:hypothetical protein
VAKGNHVILHGLGVGVDLEHLAGVLNDDKFVQLPEALNQVRY